MDYNKLALKVLSSNPLDSDLKDSISVCSYVSDIFGQELEVSEGRQL
jgi:hypothetical protein